MTPDTGKHVIICRSHGSYQAYACTLDNARAILANHVADLPREIAEMARQLEMPDRPVAFYGVQGMKDALNDLLTKRPGEESPKLRTLLYGPANRNTPDTRPAAVVKEADQQELVLWLFKNELSAKPLDSRLSDKLNDLHPERELAALAPFVQRMAKPIQYIRYPEFLEAAKTLTTLRAGCWKTDAAEHRVVEQHLKFVNESLVDTNDVVYEVVELSTSFS